MLVRSCNSRSIFADVGSSYVRPRIGLRVAEPRLAIGEDFQPPFGFRPAAAGRALATFDHTFHRLQVGEHQLGVDRVDVAHRVDAAFDVHHVFVFIAANDVQNRIHVAQVAEKLVAQTFTARGPAHQAGNVDELKNGGDDLLRFDVAVDRVEPWIGNRNRPDIRLDRAKGVILAGDPHGRQRIKERALPDVR